MSLFSFMLPPLISIDTSELLYFLVDFINTTISAPLVPSLMTAAPPPPDAPLPPHRSSCAGPPPPCPRHICLLPLLFLSHALFLVFTTCSSAPLCPHLPFCSIHSSSALLDPLWKEVMLAELRPNLDNGKWTLVSPPAGTSLVSGCVNTYSIQIALSSTTRLVGPFMATPSSPPSVIASPSAPSSNCLPYMS